MISNNFPVQPQFSNELLKQEEIIEREKNTQNITDDLASLEIHNINRNFQNDICAMSVVNQVNKPENTLEKLLPENLSKLEHYSVSTNKEIT